MMISTSPVVRQCSHHDHDPAPQLKQVDISPDEREKYRDLVDSAIDARSHAYTPNSHSQVGCAILSKSGQVYLGANIETTSYADHGEQVAIARALKAGESPEDLEACAVFVAKEGPPKPEDFARQSNMTSCGNCRQAIYELNPEMREILLAPDGQGVQVYRAGDLLPAAYGRKHAPQESIVAPADNADPLIFAAQEARAHSYAPRTHEMVGAAIETESGHIYTGIRVETSSFATQAERIALAETVMAGEKDKIKRVAIIGGKTPEGDVPTILTWDGLQAIAQLAPEAEVVLPDGAGAYKSHRIVEVPGYLLSRTAATGI